MHRCLFERGTPGGLRSEGAGSFGEAWVPDIEEENEVRECDSVPFSVSIPRADVVSDGLFLSHAKYMIQWTDMGRIRTVDRRFREFASFHEEIKALLGHNYAPEEPLSLGCPEVTPRGEVYRDIEAPGGAAVGASALQQQQQRERRDGGRWAFSWLFAVLGGKCAGGSAPSPQAALPRKTMLRNQSPAFIECRRQQLENYLRLLLQQEEVVRAWPLWGFLGGDPEARDTAKFFYYTQRDKLLRPTRELLRHIEEALWALQRMGCSISIISSGSLNRSCLPWRLAHPELGRRLLALADCGSALPLNLQIRIVDLLHLLLRDPQPLRVVCDLQAIEKVFRMLEGAYVFLCSACYPLIGPTGRAGRGGGACDPACPSISRGPSASRGSSVCRASSVHRTASEQEDSLPHSASSCDFPHHRPRPADVPQGGPMPSLLRQPEDSRGLATGGQEAGDEPANVRGGSGSVRGEEGATGVETFPFPQVSLLLTLIDGCTSFLCRLVECEPLQLLEFLKMPDALFRLNSLLCLASRQHLSWGSALASGVSRGGRQQQPHQQHRTGAPADIRQPRRAGSSHARGIAGAGRRKPCGERAPALLRGPASWPCDEGLVISDSSGEEEAGAQDAAVAAQQRREGKLEEMARHLLLLTAPFVCMTPSSTLGKALHAAGQAAGAPVGHQGATVGAPEGAKLWTEQTGEPPRSSRLPSPRLLAEVCMEAVDARVHVATALMLWSSLHLIEVQKVMPLWPSFTCRST